MSLAKDGNGVDLPTWPKRADAKNSGPAAADLIPFAGKPFHR
jgi:hypothetical protein